MALSITHTLDLEDSRPSERHPARYRVGLERILEIHQRHGTRMTVFVVGSLARSDPALVTELADAGHEIGLHSDQHIPIRDLGAEAFEADTQRGMETLAEILGKKPAGYRAPIFSLTPDVPFAPQILTDLGFEYSSSVLPAKNPLYGFPGAPSRPFRWSSGLLELPAPVFSTPLGKLPVLGGIYFRYMPHSLIKKSVERDIRHASKPIAAWSYLHPYDADPMDPFIRIRGASLPVSLLLRAKRAGTAQKLNKLLSDELWRHAPPFIERVSTGEFSSAPVFPPIG
ncbi:MAG: polysaccharide deacetylase family protein [Pseudomonadota bacterium]